MRNAPVLTKIAAATAIAGAGAASTTSWYSCGGGGDPGEPDAGEVIDAAPDASPTPDAPPDAGPDAAPDAPPPPPDGLQLTIGGDGVGEVRVEVDFDLAQTCRTSCVVPVAPGASVRLFGLSPSAFAGFSGDCAGSEAECTFTMPGAVAAVTATFAADPMEQWSRVLEASATVLSADFDGAGNLVLGTTAGLHKLSGDGADLWFDAALPGIARVDAAGDIFVVAGDTLTKVGGGGGAIWSRALTSDLGLCTEPTSRMSHTWAVAPDGSVALQRGSTLELWSGDGALAWSVADIGQTPRCAVAIAPDGTIATAVAASFFGEVTTVLRYAPTGAPLGESDQVGGQYSAAIAYDAGGGLVTSVSGHGHVDIARLGIYSHSEYVDDADWVEHGLAVDPEGNVTWGYIYSEYDYPYEGLVAHRFDPSGVELWNLVKLPFEDPFVGPFGVSVRDIAADGNGHVAIVGAFGTTTGAHAWVEVFGF